MWTRKGKGGRILQNNNKNNCYHYLADTVKKQVSWTDTFHCETYHQSWEWMTESLEFSSLVEIPFTFLTEQGNAKMLWELGRSFLFSFYGFERSGNFDWGYNLWIPSLNEGKFQSFLLSISLIFFLVKRFISLRMAFKLKSQQVQSKCFKTRIRLWVVFSPRLRPYW